MKKYIISALVVCIAMFTSCSEDKLDIPQKGVTAIEDFYITDQDAEQALVAAYQGFNWNVTGWNGTSTYNAYRFCFNLPGDDVLAAGEFFGDNDFAGQLNEFRYDTSNPVITNCYLNFIYSIYYDNLVLNYFDKPAREAMGLTQTPIMARCAAEARVLRAWQTLMLVIGWGNPPILDHLLAGDEIPYNCDLDPVNPRTHEQALLWCAQECLDAVGDLDERASKTDKNGAVKVTKGFAWAVAGKAYLFAGKYADAAATLKKVVDSGKYALVPGNRFWENFHIEGDGNEEKIFETNIVKIDGDKWGTTLMQRSTWMEANIWNWRSDHFLQNPSTNYSSIDGWGGCGVPKDFAEEWVAYGDKNRLDASIIHIDDVVANEWGYGIEKYDQMTREEKLASDELGLKSNGLYGQSFYLPLKPVCRINDLFGRGDNCRMNNFNIMRYAEVLLMYAEALIQSGQASAALPVIQEIQARAGIPTEKQAKAATMDVLKLEKKYELWLEGCRWADQLRWGDTQKSPNAGKNVPSIFDSKTAPAPAGVTDWDPTHRFYLTYSSPAWEPERAMNPGFKPEKHTFFPFPFDALAKNPNLVQHDGWNDGWK